METHKATIIRKDSKTSLKFHLKNRDLEMTLTEDKPNEVKDVFNALLEELKSGLFNFELEDTIEDLYFFVSQEYLKQLNSDLSSTFKELKDYELLS